MLTVRASLNVKKPKPRERPEAPSRMTVHSSTSPNCEKYSFKDSGMPLAKGYQIINLYYELTVGSFPVQSTNKHLPRSRQTVSNGPISKEMKPVQKRSEEVNVEQLNGIIEAWLSLET
jgi:hypothetical protein